MVRWLERNGYDVSYTTGIDAHRSGGELTEHETFLSVGHDEYWSGGQRANVEAARAAGVNLAFFSGNEVFWKTRCEPSIDGSVSANRTLVSYKETHADAKIDPQSERLDRHLARPALQPARRRRPARERAHRPALHGQRRRDDRDPAFRPPTARCASGATRASPARGRARGRVLANRTLGYEWDEDPDNGFRPGGLVPHVSHDRQRRAGASPTTVRTSGPGPPPINLTLYKARERRSGVRGRHGPVGLGSRRRARPRQQPGRRPDAAGHRQPVRRHGRPTGDAAVGPRRRRLRRPTLPPRRSTITSPANGAALPGRPADHHQRAPPPTPAAGSSAASRSPSTAERPGIRPTAAANWTYNWTPTGCGHRTRSAAGRSTTAPTSRRPRRASPAPSARRTCPCSIWDGSDGRRQNETEPSDTSAVELGVKFRPQRRRPDHRSALLQGHHQHRHPRRSPLVAHRHDARRGDLHGRDRARLAAGHAVQPGQRHRRHDLRRVLPRPRAALRVERSYFASSGFDSGPLHALGDGEDGGNGVYAYGPSRHLPDQHLPRRELLGRRGLRAERRRPDTTPPTVTGTQPGRRRHRRERRHQRDRDLQRADERRHHQRAPPSSCAVRAATAVSADRQLRRRQPGPRRSIPPAALADHHDYTATVKGGAERRQGPGRQRARHRPHLVLHHRRGPSAGGSGCPCSIWDGSTAARQRDPGRRTRARSSWA